MQRTFTVRYMYGLSCLSVRPAVTCKSVWHSNAGKEQAAYRHRNYSSDTLLIYVVFFDLNRFSSM